MNKLFVLFKFSDKHFVVGETAWIKIVTISKFFDYRNEVSIWWNNQESKKYRGNVLLFAGNILIDMPTIF